MQSVFTRDGINLTDLNLSDDDIRKINLDDIISAIIKHTNNSKLYTTLARVMESCTYRYNETPTHIRDKVRDVYFDSIWLYKMAIRLNPKYSTAYYRLSRHRHTQAPNYKYYIFSASEGLTSIDLLKCAISIEPENAIYYIELYNATPKEKQKISVNGISFERKQLFLHAIKLDPKHDKAYYYLSKELSDGQYIQLLDGRKMSKKDLLIECVGIRMSHLYLSKLSILMEYSDMIELYDGRRYTYSHICVLINECLYGDEYWNIQI